jgi:hypothetical protein
MASANQLAGEIEPASLKSRRQRRLIVSGAGSFCRDRQHPNDSPDTPISSRFSLIKGNFRALAGPAPDLTRSIFATIQK